MGTLIFVCPTTGQQVSTGVEVDRSTYRSLPRTKTAIFCPRCRENHSLSRVWAWLDTLDTNVAEITVSNAILRVARSPIIDTHT